MNNKMPSKQLTSCVNTPWPRATTPCCGQWHLFKVLIWSISVLPGILRSLWLDPILFLGLSPLALKHVVTTDQAGSRSFGERTSPGPWGYHSFAHTLFFCLEVCFFFLNLLSILHTFFHAFLQEWLDYKVSDASYGILSQSEYFSYLRFNLFQRDSK